MLGVEATSLASGLYRTRIGRGHATRNDPEVHRGGSKTTKVRVGARRAVRRHTVRVRAVTARAVFFEERLAQRNQGATWQLVNNCAITVFRYGAGFVLHHDRRIGRSRIRSRCLQWGIVRRTGARLVERNRAQQKNEQCGDPMEALKRKCSHVVHLLQKEEGGVETYPHHVDEVPVIANALKCRKFTGVTRLTLHANEQEGHGDKTNDDV